MTGNSFLAAKIRLIEGLLNGDPVAWSILGGVIVIGVVIQVVKSKKRKEQAAQLQAEAPPQKQAETPPPPAS